MPTVLGRPYDISWRGKPPHMLQTDIQVWWQFLDTWAHQYHTIYYDSLIGGPAIPDQKTATPMQRMWRANMAKRTDAIGVSNTHVDIIEVSADPGLRAIGQLQTYRALWIRDPKIQLPERLILVCSRIDPDLLDAASMYGILIYVI